jgi:tetratricopeptide (TPR) repeat protein
MNLRLLIGAVFPLLLVSWAGAQEICGENGESVQPVRVLANMIVPVSTAGCRMPETTEDRLIVRQQAIIEILPREELLRRISVYEAALRGPGRVHESDFYMAMAYGELASFYGDAAMYGQSEAAFEHAISLLRGNTDWASQLAEELDGLGLVHGQMGKLNQAEREEMEALKLRERLSDSLEIARSWNALSGLYFKEHKYAASRDFAERALKEFSTDTRADVVERISARLNLAIALCFMKACPSAVPVLEDTVAIARAAFKANDFPVGEAEFFLGFAYWKSGDVARASEPMGQGVAIMKEQLGWGHPTYLNALGYYARFLRENRRVEDAEAAEREIRRAESVVDVHSIQARNGMDNVAAQR